MFFVFYFWALGAVPGAAISVPAVALGWRRVRWYWWELFSFVLPFAAWCAAYFAWPPADADKGIGNIFGEPMLVGLLIPVAALIRIAAGKGRQVEQRRFAAAVQVGACLAGALISLAWPNMHGTI
jgi:hypothetical protein